MKIVDLTHTFTKDMLVYPGDPKASLEQIAFIEKDSFNDHRITSAMHVGTHMDAPLHMLADGETADQIDPERFFGNGVLIDVRGKSIIDASILEGIKIEEGSIVLLYTGYGSKFRTDEYYKNDQEVTADFANKMVELKIKLLGMDMPGPDLGQPWVTHKILLGNDILLLENLTNLDQLLNVDQFEIIALPAKLQSNAAFVRVVAEIK